MTDNDKQNDEKYEEIVVLDVTGLACPMPLIKLKQLLAKLEWLGGSEAKGQKIVLQASDKGALKDIPAFCAQKGLLCECVDASPPVYEFVIRGSGDEG